MRTLLFDLESTDLKAMMGRILCASFAWVTVGDDGELGCSEPWTFSMRTHPGRTLIDDSRLAEVVAGQLLEADMIVGWNSKQFDVPLLNARLAKAGFMPCQPNLHLDLMWYSAGNSMRIGSRKLDNVSKYFNVDSRKTEISWETWQLAGTGNEEALNEVIKHCEFDVKVLGQVYPHLIPYVRTIHR